MFAYQRVASAYWKFRVARQVPMCTHEALAVLGLPPTAGLVEAKKAYREMIFKHHPDRGGDLEKAIQINIAWEQLRDGVTVPCSTRPTPGPSYRPTPSQPPPRPRPTPPPRNSPPPRPTPPPRPSTYGKISWRQAEQLTGGHSYPEAKDRKRVDDFIARSKGDPVKLRALAAQMANSIKDVNKALRRGRAAEEAYDPTIVPLAQIFYKRALELAGVQ